MSSSSKKILLILAFILLLATIVRLYGIADESIWFDEAFTIHHAHQSVGRIVALQDPTPPLYMLLLHFVIKFFGDGPFAMRFPSVIFGVLSVFLIYLLGKKLFSEKAGLIAALFLSLASLHVYYAQETRAYSLFMLLSLVSMYFFISYLRSAEKRHLILYALFTLLFLYSHLFAVFLVATQFVIFLVIRYEESRMAGKNIRSSILPFLIAQGAIWPLFAPWLAYSIQSTSRIVTSSSSLTTRDAFGSITVPIVFAGGIVMGVFYLMSVCRIARSAGKTTLEEKKMFSMLLLWTILPLFLALVYSLLFSPILMLRYVLFCSLPVLLVVAYAYNNIKPAFMRCGFLAVIILLSFFTLFMQWTTLEKDRWNDISTGVASLRDGDEIIIIDRGYQVLPFLYYFDHYCFLEEDFYACAAEKNVFAIWDDGENEMRYVADTRSFIYVKTYASAMPDDDDFFSRVQDDYSVESKMFLQNAFMPLGDKIFMESLIGNFVAVGNLDGPPAGISLLKYHKISD